MKNMRWVATCMTAAARVDTSLKSDKRLDDIKVASVNNGLVLLSGKAHGIDEKLVAIESAYAVAGVKRVATEIRTIEY
jgi:osmotically-inducible protein OsmY